MSGFEQREWFSLEPAGMPCAAECTSCCDEGISGNGCYPGELPEGDGPVVGLVPCFDTRATRASRFICHSANFRLGLIILVMPADVEVRTAACLVACLHACMRT